jgi:flagellar biosynthesis anti-sigma factor FlgM
MKIDGISPSPEPQAPTFKRPVVSDGAESREVGEAPGSDGARLSATVAVGALADKLRQLPDVRQERVAALRQAVQSGQYQASDQQIADALHAQFFGKSSSTE